MLFFLFYLGKLPVTGLAMSCFFFWFFGFFYVHLSVVILIVHSKVLLTNQRNDILKEQLGQNENFRFLEM